MPEYLVEIYAAAAGDQVESVQRVKNALDHAAEYDSSFRYERTLSLREDEVCLHLVEARTAEALAEIFRRAGIRFDRLVEATETTSQRQARQ